MTPERWRQIDSLFDAAIRLGPEERGPWLCRACAGDEALRLEVGRLLAEDDGADRDGFLTPMDPPPPLTEETGSWPQGVPGLDADLPDETAPSLSLSLDASGGFTPKAVIVSGNAPQSLAETQSVMRSRLRELPMIYILIYAMAIFWKGFIVRDFDPAITTLNAFVILSLGGMALVLWGRRPISLARLKALEVGMFVLLAAKTSYTQYWLMLVYSLRDDPISAQRVMQNTVLMSSILILTCGIFVPKSWRRAAFLTGPMALLPFLTLLVLDVRHPEVKEFLGRGLRKSPVTPLAVFSFDAMLLLILAVGASYGAHTLSRLRRQVVEAKQLGQYRLRRRIGSGGMGEVYLAEHQLLKRPCAVKLIRPGDAGDPRALERFEREVRLTATLSHWNTVEIFDYGRTDDGTYYYVMEYLPGMSLADLVKNHGPLPPGRAVYLLRQVCLALREAHEAGLIHRDIKPSNIFAARRGGMDDVAKLLDFGLVRPLATVRGADLSGEGQILGTPQFMSPEQAKGGRAVDERSDIYSLGAVAYYVLTGSPPFAGEGAIEVLIAHARDPVTPPSQARAGIPEDLERVVLRCLAKAPADRFPDAESLERTLGECGCSGDWDAGLAARWWREAARGPAVPTTVA